jgi:uncharacterized protein
MFLGMPIMDLAIVGAGLLVAGVATGLLAGLFGVGGGAIIVPALYEAFRILGVPEEVRMPLCVGTSLAVIIPTAIRSYQTHKAKGKVDESILRIWAVPVVLGVIVGAVIARFAPADLFKIVFVVIATFSAAKLLIASDRWKIADDFPRGWIMRAYGSLVGVLSALMGIGGGQLSNLFMTFYGRPIHQAVATSSGLGVLIAIPGAIGYIFAGWPRMAELPPLSLGYVSLIGVALVVPTSMVFSPIGARLAHKTPKRRLEIAFGMFLLVVAARFLWTLLT